MNGKQKAVGIHKTALAALFAVGNTLIRYPWRNADPDMLILFLLSVAGALIPAFLLYPLFRILFRKPIGQNRLRTVVTAVFAVLIGAYALFCAYRVTDDYLNLAMELILPGGARWLLALLFLVCTVWLSLIPERGMDSFSLICFVGVLVSVLLLFAFGIPQYRTEYLSVSLPTDVRPVVSVLPSLWLESLLPLTVLSAYYALVTPKKGERALAFGTVAGYLVLLICVLQTLLTFGVTYASSLPYPYSFAVRIVSVGQYFFRLEGFSYVLDYTACLLRASVCLSCARRLLGRFSPRAGRWLPIVAGTAFFGILLFQ